MAVAIKLGKEFFRLLKKKLSPTNKLYKILNKNSAKLSSSCTSNVTSITNKSNCQKLSNKHIEFPICNSCNKTASPLKGKCQYECIIYKAEVHSNESKNNSSCNNNCNGKKVNVGSTQGAFKKDITTIEVVSHTKYTGTWLVYRTMCRKLKRSKV